MPPWNPSDSSNHAKDPKSGSESPSTEAGHINSATPDVSHQPDSGSNHSFLDSTGRVGLAFGESVVNSAVLKPAEAVSQLLSAGVHAASGYDLPTLSFELKPDMHELGAAGDVAVSVGGAVGFIAPLIATSSVTGEVSGRFAGSRVASATEAIGAANKVAMESIADLGKTNFTATPFSVLSDASAVSRFNASPAKMALDGALSGFVFTPTDDKNNLLVSRLEVAGINGITFGAAAGINRSLTSRVAGLLDDSSSVAARTATRIGVNALSGGAGGAINAEAASILMGHGLASLPELTRGAGQFAVTGLFFDGVQTASKLGFTRGQSAGAAERSSDLTAAVDDAQQNSEAPNVRAAVNNAVAFALADKTMPFEPTRNLLDAQLGSKFDSIRDPNAVDKTMSVAMHERAAHEVSLHPNPLIDNHEQSLQMIRDSRQPGSQVNLESSLVNPVNPEMLPELRAAMLINMARDTQPLLNHVLDRAGSTFDGKAKSHVKYFEGILGKAVRPSTVEKARERGFDFQVEHVRDSVRGKITLDDLSDLPGLATELKNEANLHGISFVKDDLEMLLRPKLSGWRGAHIDVRFPNGQLGEISLRINDIESVPENHSGYKAIRGVTDKSSPQYKAMLSQTQATFAEAWQKYLARTGQTEQDVQGYIAQMRDKLLEEPVTPASAITPVAVSH